MIDWHMLIGVIIGAGLLPFVRYLTAFAMREDHPLRFWHTQ